MILIDAVPNGRTMIGRLGENDHRGIQFPSAATLAMYPDASVTVLHKRPGDPAAYPVDPSHVRIEDGRVIWEIKSSDLSAEGTGQAEVVYTQGSTIAKTEYYKTQILPALDGSGTPPEPWESWQESLVQTVQGAYDAAEDAKEWATGLDKNGNPVPPTDKHYENNAYYFMLICQSLTGKYPKIESGYWYLWDAQNEQWVNTNVKATGENGVSPTVSVSSITGGHRITITDGTGDNTVDVMDGTNGDDGFSPTASVSKSGNTATISITDKNGTTTAQVQDGTNGAPGQDGVGVPSGGTTGQVLKKASGMDYDTEWGDEPSVPVTDVQVNGTSVLSNGVANIPLGDSDMPGAIQIFNARGLTISSHKLQINPANSTMIKNAINGYCPITPSTQNEATFYGLAQCAGDSTQSASDNAVGTYTDAAKVAIQKMLGIYQAPWELIREDTVTNATEADIIITTDGNGNAFELTDAILLFETPKQATEAKKGDYGRLIFSDGTNNVAQIYLGAWTQAANATANGGWAIIENKDGMLFISSRYKSLSTDMGGIQQSYRETFGSTYANQSIKPSNNTIIRQAGIKAVTGTGHYILYGKRKWPV